MPDTPQALADRLQQEGGRVIDFFNRLLPDQWRILIYPEQSIWTFHELLAHFVSSEIGRKGLISDVCNGGKGAPPGFDINLFNQMEVKRFAVHSNVDILEAYRLERANLILLVSSLSSLDLEKTGNDPFLGMVSVAEMIKLTYRHLQIHIREARKNIL
jgi:hypothetical protein